MGYQIKSNNLPFYCLYYSLKYNNNYDKTFFLGNKNSSLELLKIDDCEKKILH